MLTLIRTNSENKNFQNLVLELDKDLAKKNGDTNDFFAQYNKTDLIKNVVVALNDYLPVGCGAMKEFDNSTMEIKRMYVTIEMRGKGVAVAVLNDLESWAKELGYKKCVLETGDKMLEAIGLYKKSGYKIIKNYGQYENIESSICFEKEL
ncbi:MULTISPECIES: GNAT family N-acetyltransferase [Flavobacteriales]|jgi:GNAT superfamily N-acetyltransferase|uniref:GCN5-related N-acetyltransferase n=1 Tax=Fluviicola taffensis (strain DSM 16823 / NCIMB 13979 / RW262) TaxID=755732 RepID=F2IEU6_FLUTR|nr:MULTISPECIES: GNAT family N-acetyltransferase [Flavobacteriales]AEA45663.1 GCN5-related N-acetyltransferase [Fluviicola taffensis DSM 16823]MCC7331364.1 GNAT family N-acetyltransferase [Flavobacteriales bacterium]HRP90480.1 GNAT family N-acetyltransferase [Edaphocola sp.]